ncbi:MAG TPA: M1 family aminopeptidase [Pyrinomonadaceae bacterium]|nr:M1 family aminopeptidase [Pyrinomonadaceae bacterium]
MKNLFNRRNAIILAAFLFLTSGIHGQQARPDFNRASDFDIQHYVLRVSFDRPTHKVIGDTTVRLKPLNENFRRVTLDSVGISYSSVTLEQGGTPLKFRPQGGSVIVDLDRAYSPNETVGIRFQYSAVPKKGIYFMPEQKGEGMPGHSAQIWTQGEPDEARHWFPSFDFPSDKATTEQFITANRNETVVGNGTLVEKTDNPDGTVTHHFKMDAPHSTYLISFVLGEYAVVKEKYREIPLGYYIYPGTESVVPKAYGRTGEMIRVFEEFTQVEFPFAKYDQTIVSAFNFGGMENITATTMADTEILLVNNPLFAGGVEDLVSHELAHSWFGNLVTCKNWAELWLNEGFATFMEAAFREKAYGRRNYIVKILSDAEEFKIDDAVNTKRNGLFNRNAGNVSALFERAATTYDKGGVVLHMLREQVGDAAFWRAVNIYLNRHKFGSVESTDLRKAMEEASGQDLGWFFNQWVYGLGSPKLTVKQAYNPGSKTLTLTVSQTQKLDRLTPPAFRLPLDVEVHSGRNVSAEKIELRKRVETFRIKVASRPTKLVFDKDEKIPLKMVKILPLAK